MFGSSADVSTFAQMQIWGGDYRHDDPVKMILQKNCTLSINMSA